MLSPNSEKGHEHERILLVGRASTIYFLEHYKSNKVGCDY